MDLLHALAFIAGTVVVLWGCISAIRAFMIPGSRHHLLGRIVFRVTQVIFLQVGRLVGERGRARFYPLFAPLGLLAVYGIVILLAGIGFAFIFWAISGQDLTLAGAAAAFIDSGSALSTLGFAELSDLPRSTLSVIEALVATTISALLIGYLPVIFSTYLSTEHAVTDLEAETGGARCATEVLAAIQRSRTGDDIWKAWSKWFGRLGKHHGSLVGNLFLRAPEAHTSWVTAAGSVLDAAALRKTVIAGPADPDADYCYAAGVDAARRAVGFLGFDHCAERDPDPVAEAAISREEFDAACRQLAAAGLPLRPDPGAAYGEFAALRAAYRRELATLAALKGSPMAAIDCGPSSHPAPMPLPVRTGQPLAPARAHADASPG